MWIHYIGGLGAGDKLIAVEIGLGEDPEGYMAKLREASPFQLNMLKVEEGTIERFEALQESFRKLRLQGSWYRATSVLRSHIEALPAVDRRKPKTRRVSLLLPPDEFAELERAVGVMGTKTKNRLARMALRSYLQLVRYHALGYRIQAIRNGKLVQFEDLDSIKGPDDDQN